MVDVPGLDRLTNKDDGQPATVHRLPIDPDGQRAVCRDVVPSSHALNLTAAVPVPAAQGTVIARWGAAPGGAP